MTSGQPGLIRRRHEQAGAAALEFAIVAPLLIALLTGMMYFGLALFARIVVTEAAHAAVRSCVLQQRGDASQGAYGSCASEQFTTLMALPVFSAMCDNGMPTPTTTFSRLSPALSGPSSIVMMTLTVTCNRNINPVVNVAGDTPVPSTLAMQITSAMPLVLNTF